MPDPVASELLQQLDQRHRQVLRFVATYTDEQGCLPSSAEVAIGCGIGSTSTVLRVLRDLEVRGLIERDGQYPRLGRVTVALPVASLDAELYLTELAVRESRGNLEILRRGLTWAPDTDAVGFLHREGTARATLLRAYEEAHVRLVASGVSLSRDAMARVDAAAARIGERHALIDGWEPYCLYSTAITLAARRWTIACERLGLAHLEPVFVTESVVYDLDVRLDRLVAADFARRRPDEAGRLVRAFMASMEATLASMPADLGGPGLVAIDPASTLDAVAAAAPVDPRAFARLALDP